jgi:hypothetical protein
MEDSLYNNFYRLFPDYGQRTNMLRRCVHRLVQRAVQAGGILPNDIEEVAEEILKKEGVVQ